MASPSSSVKTYNKHPISIRTGETPVVRSFFTHYYLAAFSPPAVTNSCTQDSISCAAEWKLIHLSDVLDDPTSKRPCFHRKLLKMFLDDHQRQEKKGQVPDFAEVTMKMNCLIIDAVSSVIFSAFYQQPNSCRISLAGTSVTCMSSSRPHKGRL